MKNGEIIEQTLVLGVDEQGLIEIRRGAVTEKLAHGERDWVLNFEE